MTEELEGPEEGFTRGTIRVISCDGDIALIKFEEFDKVIPIDAGSGLRTLTQALNHDPIGCVIDFSLDDQDVMSEFVVVDDVPDWDRMDYDENGRAIIPPNVWDE